jgi:hypothetical protein
MTLDQPTTSSATIVSGEVALCFNFGVQRDNVRGVAERRFDDESEIDVCVFWSYCGRASGYWLRVSANEDSARGRSNDVIKSRPATVVKQCPRSIGRRAVLCDGHSGYIRQFPKLFADDANLPEVFEPRYREFAPTHPRASTEHVHREFNASVVRFFRDHLVLDGPAR